jgi:ribosomal protein S18 acetylase RimI-like enzyme
VIEIRPCTPEDAAEVSALLEDLGYELSSETAAERVQRLNATGSDPVFIACEDRRPLGLAALHSCSMIQYRRPVARITALIVHRQARRRGIGRLLIRHALLWAEQSGCELVELTSALNRTAAHAFYRRLGFESNSLRFRKLLSG